MCACHQDNGQRLQAAAIKQVMGLFGEIWLLVLL